MMKKILILSFLIFVLIGCNKKSPNIQSMWETKANDDSIVQITLYKNSLFTLKSKSTEDGLRIATGNWEATETSLTLNSNSFFTKSINYKINNQTKEPYIEFGYLHIDKLPENCSFKNNL